MNLMMLGQAYPRPYLGQVTMPPGGILDWPSNGAAESAVAASGINTSDPWYKKVGTSLLEGLEKYGDFWFQNELEKTRNEGKVAQADALANYAASGGSSAELGSVLGVVGWAVGGTVAIVGIVALIILMRQRKRRG